MKYLKVLTLALLLTSLLSGCGVAKKAARIYKVVPGVWSS